MNPNQTVRTKSEFLTENMQTLSLHDSPITQLSPKLLKIIFKYTLPPTFLLDSSLSRGPNSVWCISTRTKKTIISVCKSWYNTGVSLLYQDIVFRRCMQIPALLDTLRNKPSLGGFVKHIHISCYFPDDMVEACEENISEIYLSCPQLTSLDTLGQPFTENPLSYIPVPNPQGLTKFSCNIRAIPTFPDIYWNSIQNSLTDLHLYIPNDFTIRALPTGSLHFPSVVSLRCTFQRQIRLERFSQAFNLPSLRHLAIRTDNDMAPFRQTDGAQTTTFAQFLKACGQELRYLDVAHVRARSYDLSSCPALEHLVVGTHNKVVLKPYRHDNLQIIDTYECGLPKIQENFADINWANLPNLKYVRRLVPCGTLRDASSPGFNGVDYECYAVAYPFMQVECRPEIIYCSGDVWNVILGGSMTEAALELDSDGDEDDTDEDSLSDEEGSDMDEGYDSEEEEYEYMDIDSADFTDKEE